MSHLVRDRSFLITGLISLVVIGLFEFLILLDSVLEVCIFLGIYPCLPDCSFSCLYSGTSVFELNALWKAV